MSTLLQRKGNEGYYDYLDRLYSNKATYGIDCNKIAVLMNNEFNTDFGESKFRKQWTYFNDGRMYERSLHYADVHTRILAIGDLHVPFNLPVSTFNEYAGKVDILVINGDLVDMQSISRFPKAYRQSPMEEIVLCREFLIELIELLNPRKVIANYGNHDVRFQSYLSKNLDSDLLELMPMTPLELIFDDGFRRYDKRSRSKIWYDPLVKVFPDKEIIYTGDWKCRVGECLFTHPSAYKGGILNTARKAMEHLLITEKQPFQMVCMHHTHKTGDAKVGDIFLYEAGCCCQTDKLDYNNGRLTDPQQMGFVWIAQDKDGNFLYESTDRVIL